MTGILFDTPAAGWYPDPISSKHVRWWDGRAWTERQVAQPSAFEDVAPPMPPPNPVEQLRPRREALAKDGWTKDPTPGARTIEPSWLGYSGSADWRDTLKPQSWSTPGSWALAFSPWLSVGAVLLSAILGQYIDPVFADIVAIAAFVLVVLVAVISDRGQLAAWHHVRPASSLWILLGTFFYLLARAISVHRNVRRGLAPLIVYVVNVLLVATVGVVWYLFLPV
jgi:hypothetical protein